ncbi:Uncharacterised protein [uncultured archaeon]|nr:Uncharacterised protein [uncultured archaeon]
MCENFAKNDISMVIKGVFIWHLQLRSNSSLRFMTAGFYLILPLANEANIPIKQRIAKTVNAAFSLLI